MTGSNLLDTNIVIELFKGNSTITVFLETLEEEINIPFAVLGELYLGAYSGETNLFNPLAPILNYL